MGFLDKHEGHYYVRLRFSAYSLFLSVAFFSFLLFGVSSQAQSWFPAGAVQCSLGNPTVNLGIVSRIIDPTPSSEGSFNISCQSNAYPTGYPSDYRTVEGGYCLNIIGTRALKGTGKNSAISIPFDFYNDTHKVPDPNRPQDFTTPIGDGTYGIAFFDWDYRDGAPNRLTPPSQGREYFPVPVKSLFEARVRLDAIHQAYPAGIYQGNFTFKWVAGEVKQAGTFPKVTEGPGVCGSWQGTHGSGAVNVRLEIKKYCYVSTKNDINFGRQIALNKPLNQEGTIEVECSEGTQYGVAINDGLNSGGKGKRAMKRENGTETINYELYQDAAHTRPWGSNWGSSDIYSNIGTAGAVPLPVYAEVMPQQGYKPAGIYKDVLVVEVRVTDPGDM